VVVVVDVVAPVALSLFSPHEGGRGALVCLVCWDVSNIAQFCIVWFVFFLLFRFSPHEQLHGKTKTKTKTEIYLVLLKVPRMDVVVGVKSYRRQGHVI
jgi:hypothetical protein